MKTYETDEIKEMAARLKTAVEFLLDNGYARRQYQIAEKLKANPSSFSQAINANPVNMTRKLLSRFYLTYKDVFNKEWVMNGIGEMLRTTSKEIATNINVEGNVGQNVIVGNGNRLLATPMEGIKSNKYADSPEIERRWKPVIPAGLIKAPNMDLLAVARHNSGIQGDFLYSGTAMLDMWVFLDHNDLFPYFQIGDCIGLRAYEENDRRILEGEVYGIDTKRDGLIIRRLRYDENGDFVAFTFNDKDDAPYHIPSDDVIRIYKKVISFRY